MKQTIKDVLCFEIFYKVLILFLVEPFLKKGIVAFYSIPGDLTNLNFNLSGLTLEDYLVFILILFVAAILALFELNMLVMIVWKNAAGRKANFLEIMDLAIARTGEMFRWKNFWGIFYLLLLIPLAHVGWRLTIPSPDSLINYVDLYFIQHGTPVYATIIARTITGLLLCLNFVWIFIPYLMIIKNQSFCEAVRSSRRLFKQLLSYWPERVWKMALVYLFVVLANAILMASGKTILSDSDLSFTVVRYMFLSADYRHDLFFRIVYTLLQIMMNASLVWMIGYALRGTGLFRVLNIDIREARGEKKRYGQKFLRFFPDSWQRYWENTTFVHYWTIVFYSAILILVLFCTIEIPLLHKPWVIGHRGSGSTAAVENTAGAYEYAASVGADAGELDVHLTKDGQLVVLHDDTLKRLAGDSRKIEEMTLAEIQSLTLKQGKYTATADTLGEIIQTVKNASDSMMLLIELKPVDGNDKEMAIKVIHEVEKYDFGDRAFFMSFSLDAVRELQNRRPDWWIGYCAYGLGDKLDESTWDYNFDFLALSSREITYSLIAEARSHHVPVYVWTVKSTDDAAHYYSIGCEAVITNQPQKMVPIRDEFLSENNDYVYQGSGYPKGAGFVRT